MGVCSGSSPASTPPAERLSTPATPVEVLFEADTGSKNTDLCVLVTGGLGFIGSHTVLELLKAGYNVIIVDNVSNSSPDVFSRILKSAEMHCVAAGKECPKAEFIKMDYRDESRMRTFLESYSQPFLDHPRIMGVIHFAAYKAVEESIRQPLKYYKNNITGLIDFTDLLGDYGIKNFIFSSSAAVYGNLAEANRFLQEENVVHETAVWNDTDGVPRVSQAGYSGITSPYGRTKFFGEAILFDVAQSDPAWNIIALRYFNPISCDSLGLLGEEPAGIPSNLLPLVLRVMSGETPCLSVYGNDWDTHDGTAVRDFIHVSDLAKGHVAALSAIQRNNIPGGFRTYNLGVGKGYSVLDVISTMEYVSEKPIPRAFVGRRKGDVQSSVAAADRARLELGWQTQKTLLDACRDSINFLSARHGSEG